MADASIAALQLEAHASFEPDTISESLSISSDDVSDPWPCCSSSPSGIWTTSDAGSQPPLTMSPAKGKHLIVLLHGVFGSSADWSNWVAVWQDELQPAVRSMYEFCVVDLKGQTLKGINHMAGNACDQVEAFLVGRPGGFTHFSMIGHSFGGVYSKKMLLMRHDYRLFSALKPKNFITLASPHLGISGSKTQMVVAKWFFSTTGKDLLLADEGRCLPQVTCDSIQELRAFPNLMSYANTTRDYIVPYSTSAIQLGGGRTSPRCTTGSQARASASRGTGITIRHSPSCHCHACDSAGTQAGLLPRQLSEGTQSSDETSIFNKQAAKHDPQRAAASRGRTTARRLAVAQLCEGYVTGMYTALDSLPWTRIDVSIPHMKSHEQIMLKSHRTRKELHPIIQHVLDHFVF